VLANAWRRSGTVFALAAPAKENKTMWQFKISDPSGETRTILIKGANMKIGNHPESTVMLRDPTAPPHAATITARPQAAPGTSPFWIEVPDGSKKPVRIGDIECMTAHLPEDVPLRISESILTLEKTAQEKSLPPMSRTKRAWLTCSESGTKMLWLARKAAPTPLSIFISGETGTGKEVIAELIHSWSERAAGPFIPINCGALPLSLAESELFGHTKGAFTGAAASRSGALMQAHMGTLFLDEVGDLPHDIQIKLLRFLENGEIRPVGADRAAHANVRLLCATHKPLMELVEQGHFRRDLYYRIASITIDIPPLRTRPDDVRMLATGFAAQLGKKLSPKAVLRLQAHAWPGNVRELRHAIERAAGIAGPLTSLLAEDEFAFLLTSRNLLAAPALELGPAALSLKEMERLLLVKALRISRGNRTNASKILGIARSTLFVKIKKHRIKGPCNREIEAMVA